MPWHRDWRFSGKGIAAALTMATLQGIAAGPDHKPVGKRRRHDRADQQAVV